MGTRIILEGYGVGVKIPLRSDIIFRAEFDVATLEWNMLHTAEQEAE